MIKGFVGLVLVLLITNAVFFGYLHHVTQWSGSDQIIKLYAWTFRSGEISFYANLLSSFSTTLAVFAAALSLIVGTKDRKRQYAHNMAAEWSKFRATEYYLEIATLELGSTLSQWGRAISHWSQR